MSSPSVMLLYIHLVLAIFASGSQAKVVGTTVDLMPSVDGWFVPDRVSRCPVHKKIQPKQDPEFGGVMFDVHEDVDVPLAKSRDSKFSVVEIPVTGGLGGFQGLRVNFSSTGIQSWRLRLYDGEKNVRFVHVLEKPDGMHTVVIPWDAFVGEHLSRYGISQCGSTEMCHYIHPPTISEIGVMLQLTPNKAQLRLHNLQAIATWEDGETSGEAPTGTPSAGVTSTVASMNAQSERGQFAVPGRADTTASNCYHVFPLHSLWLAAISVLRSSLA